MNYLLEQLDAIAPVECPCGQARRAFASPENKTATLHVVDIKTDSEVHYHKKMTEIYFILEGEGYMELDGERVPVRPMTSVLIKPGCRHRAGRPDEDRQRADSGIRSGDEWFD